MPRCFMQGRLMASNIDQVYQHIANKLSAHEIIGIRITPAPVQVGNEIWWEWVAEFKEAKE